VAERVRRWVAAKQSVQGDANQRSDRRTGRSPSLFGSSNSLGTPKQSFVKGNLSRGLRVGKATPREGDAVKGGEGAGEPQSIREPILF